MSLAERVTSLETYESPRGLSPAGVRDGKLSFNPVGTRDPPMAHKEPVAAFEVSKIKRLSQVLVAVIYCFLAAGVVFGYAAIKPILIREGVYRDLCSQDEVDEGVRVCYEQELRYVNLVMIDHYCF